MRRGLSLRAQLTVVVALIAALPNVVLVVAVWLPSVWSHGTLPPGAWNTVGIWLGGVVVLSAAVGYLGSGQLLAPLTRVTRDVEALPLAARRIAAARLAMTGREPREVAALKRSFNELLNQVQLEQSRRNAFMAALMHDLKTPLIAANHLLEIVRDSDDLTRDMRVTLVSRLTTENQALIELVQRMVDAHRLEREEVQLHREEASLAGLLEAIAKRIEPLTRERGVRLGGAWGSTRGGRPQGARTGPVQPVEQRRALRPIAHRRGDLPWPGAHQRRRTGPAGAAGAAGAALQRSAGGDRRASATRPGPAAWGCTSRAACWRRMAASWSPRRRGTRWHRAARLPGRRTV